MGIEANKDILTLGIDVGSSTSKCVLMKNGTELINDSVISAGTGTSGPKRAVDAVLSAACITPADISATAATGYGRNSVEAGRTYTELSCHARGAAWLYPGVRTVIDIGGQDCKALSVTPEGRLGSFVMNDKCAAGTGRFLEVMARILEIDLADMGRLGALATKPVDITSTCTVFAESEVISRLAQGVETGDLLAGIHRSVAVRAAGLARRLGVNEPVFMTGGVAQNAGVLNALMSELGLRVETDHRAQLAGAIGAAIFAFDDIRKQFERS